MAETLLVQIKERDDRGLLSLWVNEGWVFGDHTDYQTRSVSANDMFVQFNARRKGTTIRINKAERMESLKIRLIPQFKKTLKGNTVTK